MPQGANLLVSTEGVVKVCTYKIMVVCGMKRTERKRLCVCEKLTVMQLADFGCSKQLLTEQTGVARSIHGTPYWMAPEVCSLPCRVYRR
jgi:serine/threonine protein kinase